MSRRDRNHRHTGLMLLACAFAFVYLLARQFQWDDLVQQRHNIPAPELPDQLTNIITDDRATIDATPTNTSPPIIKWTGDITFSTLNALPSSFVRLWLVNTQGIMTDAKRVIISTNTNAIKRSGDSKTLTTNEITQIWLKADSLTFYNDQSWANILVVMEVVHNQQSLLLQMPYSLYREDKAYINSLIVQLTQ